MMKQENKEILENFLKYCKEYLKLTTLPKIKLTNDKSKTSTLAHYSPDSNEILVYIKNRAIGDWLRSLAHELIHAKQNEKNELDDNSGKTGSKHENQANSIAGIIMRNFGKKYPKLYMAPLNEIQVSDPKYDTRISRYGTKLYYKKGTDILHRVGGPAMIYNDGESFEWYQNNKLHRLDGPALISRGFRGWYQKGLRHRLDGPAIEKDDGNNQWYINDEEYSEDEFNEKIKELNNNEMINEVRKGISEKIKDIKNSNLQNEAAKYKKTGILLDDTIKAYESLIGEAEKHGLVKEVKYLNGKKDYYCSLKEKVNSKLEILESNLQPETKDDEIIENN